MLDLRPDVEGLPETVPARMVNEFVYCPRLFYLEWVQGRFATSDDVEEGQYVHRVVDTSDGDLPAAETDLEQFAGRRARSVWLTSPELGISAKVDMVQVAEDGAVIPVEYKKGHPDPHGAAWPADAVQSTIHTLLLLDAGYRVDHAEIWYGEVRRRVTVEMNRPQLDSAVDILRDLWRTAAADAAPAPLDASPKCPRCSLVGLCLPDEINALRAHKEMIRRPRGIMAADPDCRPIYLQEQGAVVGVARGRLEVSKEGRLLGSFRLIDVSQVCLQGNITVTAQAVRELSSRETPICWFSYGGWFSGMTSGLPNKHVDLRRRQYTLAPDVALAAAGKMIEGKIRNSRTLLRRNTRASVGEALDQMLKLALSASSPSGYPSLLGFEGTAARIYFSHFTGMLAEGSGVDTSTFNQNGRNRRPPPDAVNALLSFLYTLLVKDLTVTLNAIGFDPYAGVYHRPRYGRPALALDLAEEFRPLIADSTVVQLINNGEVRQSQFTVRAWGCQLDRDGRRAVIEAYERRMAHEIKHPVFGYRVNYRRALDVQARLLAAHLTGEVDSYTPFTTR